MNAKMTSLFAGIALLAGVGIANAEERLTAASMDGVTAAGYNSVYFNKDIYTNVQAYLNVYKDVDSYVNVDGKLADAEAAASCSAYSCLTETLTVTNTGYYGPTTSYSQSLSATD
ncbi:hypothetical protein SAMN05216299_12120 [Nitrosospira sp. Nsp14]|uniref:hypothetical protein n=1 Tax=Nitrosospira sp. Nsp14 TaxID=1855333 RepID=UPI0008F1FCCA|nr:hypothetical protein [Nitrosospira sp. Nsp14]SFH54856.1 hypothetical protein SAMN05216299_12120 [Nitrosospira sp. Nsp14]